MSRIKRGSRIVLLGTAFVAVMAGTGGFAGAIAGVMLVLLSQAVMGLNAGFAELMPGSVAFGMVVAMSLGIFLMARQAITMNLQPGLVSTTRSEQKQISS